jgi:UDP-N-acetylmuramyl tripeptide synthase
MTAIKLYSKEQVDSLIAGLIVKSPQPLTFTNNVINGLQENDIVYVHIVDANGNASSVTFIKKGSVVTRVTTIGTVLISFDPTSNVISLVDTSTSTSIGITSLFGYYIRP